MNPSVSSSRVSGCRDPEDIVKMKLVMYVPMFEFPLHSSVGVRMVEIFGGVDLPRCSCVTI
jgi:hypothetical protein